MEIIWDASRLCLYLLWLGADGLFVHFCDAWAKNGASVGDWVMGLGLMGQFLMVLFLTISRNWASVGWPVMA
jgi:hypothetical protein